MAFVRSYNPLDDDESRQNQQNTSPKITTEASTDIGPGGSGSNKGLTVGNQNQQTGSGTFMNLQRWLDANKTGGSNVGTQVANDIQSNVNTAKQSAQQAQSGFNQKVQEGTLQYNQGLVDQAAQNAANYLNNTELQKQLSGQYGGPTQYLGSEGDIAAQKDINKASQRANLAENESGRSYLIGDIYAKQGQKLGQGGVNLNQFLMNNTQPAIENVRTAVSAAKPLAENYTTQVQNIQKNINDAITASQGVKQQAIGRLQQGGQSIQANINAAQQAAQQKANQEADVNQYMNVLSQASRGGYVPDAMLAKVGLTRQALQNILNTQAQAQELGGQGIDLSQFLTPGQAAKVGTADVVNDEQLRNLNALSQLTGQNFTNFLKYGTQGQGPRVDMTSAMGQLQNQYQQGLQAKQLAEQQRLQREQQAAWAAAQAKAQADQAAALAAQQKAYQEYLAQQAAQQSAARAAAEEAARQQQAAQQAAYQKYLEEQAAQQAAQQAAYQKWLEDMLAQMNQGNGGTTNPPGGGTGGGTTTPPRPGLGESWAPPLPQRRPDEPGTVPPPNIGVPPPTPGTPVTGGGGGGGGDYGGGNYGGDYGSGGGSIYIPEGVPVTDGSGWPSSSPDSGSSGSSGSSGGNGSGSAGDQSILPQGLVDWLVDEYPDAGIIQNAAGQLISAVTGLPLSGAVINAMINQWKNSDPTNASGKNARNGMDAEDDAYQRRKEEEQALKDLDEQWLKDNPLDWEKMGEENQKALDELLKELEENPLPDPPEIWVPDKDNPDDAAMFEKEDWGEEKAPEEEQDQEQDSDYDEYDDYDYEDWDNWDDWDSGEYDDWGDSSDWGEFEEYSSSGGR